MDEGRDSRARWTEADIPSQVGRVAVITGGNTGIGLETARALAERGATVVLACRDMERAGAAVAQIEARAPGAAVRAVRLDLGSLASVREAAGELRAAYDRIDLLVNNAGVLSFKREVTADGFELQLGVNHLGHFALTGLLLDRLRGVPGSRIVTVASIAHRQGDMDFDDLQWERAFRGFPAYGRSKLANLLFTYELQRRLAAAGAKTIALAAHPGGSNTSIVRGAPGWMRALSKIAERLQLGQSVPMAALASLRCAVDPGARGGEYYGPPGRFGMTGFPARLESSARSRDEVAQRRLWEESERLTGVTYAL
ncbi:MULTISPECIES: oxidoreductase [Sorangium]|uniref:Short-chain dehydrogenase n=1 Tax=Sorangium cellulosum TaxID=56 RepID=A0A4P2QI54_SORCE|nr:MULTISPECIES: oxidoreductase [Sorangium]AUX29278.1 short-chain dehydrogenase [Sorangium cellulosum]WCQ88668.1 FabG-like 3-oxoacyl-(acyl-carrier-protein) reductase [Sorangium sp. Soce836]